MKRIYRYIETANELAGSTVSYFFPILTGILSFEVVARYVFHKSQIWTWDMATMLQILIVMGAGGYGLVHRSHVRVDVLMTRFSKRTNRIMALITTPLVLFGIGALLWTSTERAWSSVLMHERLSSLWKPPIYPVRVALVLGVLLLLMQALGNYLALIKGEKE